MPVGVYISVPFCRTKCSFCNFASNVFSKAAYENYVVRVIEDISNARRHAEALGCTLSEVADSIYLGGGTPSVLAPGQLARMFEAVRSQFTISHDCEITVECAPGTITPQLIETLVASGVNRVSLGVQSFVDKEAKSVGRLHTRSIVLDDIRRLRLAGLSNVSVDLIAGLPHQTAESWKVSVAETIATGVPHVSVYMLEVDDESRLGSELIAGGARYHAHFVPDDDATANFYQAACEMLEQAGVLQYEISNFARTGSPAEEDYKSRHNLKYWTRQPYVGFGVDAHSMLERCATAHSTAICGSEWKAMRFATPDSLDPYMNRVPHGETPINEVAIEEEEFFLGLRLNQGIDLASLRASNAESDGPDISCRYALRSDARIRDAAINDSIRDSIQDGLLERYNDRLRLTPRGRLLSNEVFARFLQERSGNRQRETTLVGR